MDQFQKSKEMPKGQQGFGSKQVRGFNVDITKQRAAPTAAVAKVAAQHNHVVSPLHSNVLRGGKP